MAFQSVLQCMEKLLDQNYPEPFDAGVLKSPDPFLNKVLQSQLRKLRPELFDWHWQRGAEIQIGEGKRKDFWDPSFWWISRKFKAGTGRIYRDLNTSHAVNFADLGNGWRLLCGGIDPNGKERSRNKSSSWTFSTKIIKQSPLSTEQEG